MFERIVVTPPRRTWMLLGVALAISIAGLVARAPAPEPRRCTFAPPVVPCDAIESLGVCVASGRSGAVIVRVTQGSLADREGWEPGDLIEEVACREVRTAEQVRIALVLRPQPKIVRDGVTIRYRLLEQYRARARR